jgi:hypothetical protein
MVEHVEHLGDPVDRGAPEQREAAFDPQIGSMD